MIAEGECLNGRYDIRTLMFQGSLANIWEAFDRLLERRVVVKFMKANTTLGDYTTEDLLRYEAKAMAKLEHPHLVPLYDYGRHDGDLFTVQRYISTNRLHERLNQGYLLPFEALLLAQRLSSAIDFLHKQGYVHGDLKASNIILDDQYQPYVTNFAVAPLNNEKRVSAAKEGRGTLYNLAPEQFSGEQVGFRSDLFAFGLLLHHCFVGGLPYGHDNPFANCLLERETQLPSVRMSNPELPIGVDLVLNRLTRLNPEERYASASAAIDALTHAFYSGQNAIEGKVFISYARKDQEFVHTLARELRHIGVDVWIDQDIEPGHNWDKTIEDALKNCQKMLLVWSPAANQSENVHDEWSYFLEQGKPVFPFIYQDCEMTFRLRRRQYVVSTGDLLSDVSRIIDILAGGLPTSLHSPDSK